MPKKHILITLLLSLTMLFFGCVKERLEAELPKVYFTNEITPEAILAIYKALGLEVTGNVAVKIHPGEPGNPHYLRPELIKDLVQYVNGTLVETNVAYGGPRGTTESHYLVFEQHGFTAIAPVAILDGTGEVSLPVENGKHLTDIPVGARWNEFDFHIILSHFKGHGGAGFGGAMKNLAVGYASARGKRMIHDAGRKSDNVMEAFRRTNPVHFLEAMVEAKKTLTDRLEGRVLYINVLNNLSLDCDCVGRPRPPTMGDIGILASLDPIALDQASVDMVFNAIDGHELKSSIERHHGLRALEYAEELGIGKREYVLVELK